MTDADSKWVETVLAAAEGRPEAAEEVLAAVRDEVYRLALRMLGHPADAEDATQEILVQILTHLGSFRGESKFSTWVWRIAANHLLRVRRGRREVVTFDSLDERLRTGLRESTGEIVDPEAEALSREVRLRCTEAMLLGLDRELRVAYLLGDVFGLSNEEGAAVLGIEAAAYRKRLSRARARLYAFMRSWCGVLDPANECRCRGQVSCAVERKVIERGDLYLLHHPVRPTKAALDRAASEVSGLMRVGEVMREHPDYAAPEAMVRRVRGLLDSRHLELLRQ